MIDLYNKYDPEYYVISNNPFITLAELYLSFY